MTDHPVVEPANELSSSGASVSAVDVPAVAGRSKRRRTKQAAFVLGAAIASAGIGVLVGTRIKSPADVASSAAAPAASLITVPVESKTLVATLTVSGTVGYSEPTNIRLAGAVGASAGANQVATRIPELGAEVVSGSLLMEVSGRPVFALQGELPMYRQLAPGSKGPDVLQLETALNTLGFNPGALDDMYDSGTEAALDAFYQANGYTSEGPSDDQRKALTDARKVVNDATAAVTNAKTALASGSTSFSESERVSRTVALQQAKAAVPAAQQRAATDNTTAANATATATALRDNARALYDNANAVFIAASLPGAVNPSTGEPYTAIELGELQSNALSDQQAQLVAQKDLDSAVAAQTEAAAQGDLNVKAAQDALLIAQASFNDLSKPADTSDLKKAVTAAQAQLAEAQASLTTLEDAAGTIMPAGEVVFLPIMPTNVVAVNAALGAAPPADLVAQVSSTKTVVTGSVAKVDGDLLKVGTPVAISVPNWGVKSTGVLIAVQAPKADQSGSGQPATPSDRLEISVKPDDPTQFAQMVNESARITITVSSTGGDVMAVPVAAVTVGPDGSSRVEIETTPKSASRDAVTVLVDVSLGLSAQGYVEITPVAKDALAVGDRVVIGSDSGRRRRRRSTATTTDTSNVATTAPAATG